MPREPEYDPDTDDFLLTPAETSAATGIKPSTLAAAKDADDTTRGGRLPRATVNARGQRRYRASLVKQWREAHGVGSDDPDL